MSKIVWPIIDKIGFVTQNPRFAIISKSGRTGQRRRPRHACNTYGRAHWPLQLIAEHYESLHAPSDH